MNSCTYDHTPNSFDCPPDSYHPPHPTYETYSYDSYGNDSQFGYDCQPRFSLNYESEQGYNENYTSYPYDSSSLPQHTTTHYDISLPDYEAFYFDDDHIKDISSGSTSTHSDISLPEYDSFIFEEFADELAHIISPPKYDCYYFKDLPDQ
nr:hypothetical protein [Tanacetum cinerariifolium]